MGKIWVVRADSWWYKFEDKQLAENHYNYLLNNINEKYKNIDKLYIAEYDKNNNAKILKIWHRENEKEMN